MKEPRSTTGSRRFDIIVPFLIQPLTFSRGLSPEHIQESYGTYEGWLEQLTINLWSPKKTRDELMRHHIKRGEDEIRDKIYPDIEKKARKSGATDPELEIIGMMKELDPFQPEWQKELFNEVNARYCGGMFRGVRRSEVTVRYPTR